MINAMFVMEQHLGHQTYYQNLQRYVDTLPQVNATWVPVVYPELDWLWTRTPKWLHYVRGTLAGRAQVRQQLAHATSDVVFFNTQVPAVLGGRHTRRAPYVIATDITPLQYDQMSKHYGHAADRPGPLKRYKHQANVATLRGAAHLLPWSHWTRASLIVDYGIAPERITVVPPGVDLARWRPQPRAADGVLRILFVGGDFYRKGGETLLHAFRMLPRGAAELHLVTRTRIAPEHGVRLYHDFRPNDPALVALYQSADVFVLPSEAEAFGIAAAEAAAAGLPDIVTAVGGLTDIVVDGETGFLVTPGDATMLAARLRCLLDDPQRCRSMGLAARAHAERCFDAQRNAALVVRCLHTALERQAEVVYVA